MKDKIYSRANASGGKAHIFNHRTGKLLCGSTLYYDFHPNKTMFDAHEMAENHSMIAIRRGKPNAYKFCCRKCEMLIKEK